MDVDSEKKRVGVALELEATAGSGGSSSSPTQATDQVDALYTEAMRDVVALEAASESESSPRWVSTVAVMQIDNDWIRCSVCSQNLLYLNCPVFQCNNGHLACQMCRAGCCTKCNNGGFDARNTVVERFILDSKFKCPHRGCHGFLSYREVTAHNDACPQAPCSCHCGFAGPPHRLLRHLVSQHSWSAYPTQYGKVLSLRLRVPASGPGRQLILSLDDARVFALVVGKLHESTAVSLVCVRAGASPSPSYKARLRAYIHPCPSSVVAGSKSTVAMEMVTSSSRPGEVVVENLPCVLRVPRTYQITGDEAYFLKILVVIFRGD